MAIRKHASIKKSIEQPLRLANAWSFRFIAGVQYIVSLRFEFILASCAGTDAFSLRLGPKRCRYGGEFSRIRIWNPGNSCENCGYRLRPRQYAVASKARFKTYQLLQGDVS